MRTYTLIEQQLDNGLEVHQATPDDTSDIVELLTNTARWLKSKGSTQWSALLDGHDVHGTGDAIKHGDVFMFKDGNIVAAMVILLTEPSPWDLDLWGDDGHDPSFYVHRLAINRDYAGQGLGNSVMQWIESGIRIEGKPQIRLDCIESNNTLFRFYSGAGYEHKGAVKGFHLFEKASAAHQS
ncbi:GNAT family N-acetyltransferase [Paenibacillus marinisediminis]